jgi:hypothetical protein
MTSNRPQRNTPDSDQTPGDVAVPAEAEARTAGDVAVEPATDQVPPAAADDEDRKGKVAVKLAHPLDKVEDLRRLRLDDEKEGGYRVGDEVWLSPDDARTLITAGYAQTDPENKAAVEAVLAPKTDA